MGRNKKMKNVRTLDDLYKGDDKHDDAPVREWETDFAIEKRKMEAKQRKEQRMIESRKRVREEKLKEKDKASITDMKIKPNESLRAFNDRVETETRLLQAAQAKQARNQRRKQRKEEKQKAKYDLDKEMGFDVPEDDDDEVAPTRKRPLPRFLDVAEQPPQLENVYHDKKRFVGMAQSASSSKEQQMAAMSQRVQGLYKKNKGT